MISYPYNIFIQVLERTHILEILEVKIYEFIISPNLRLNNEEKISKVCKDCILSRVEGEMLKLYVITHQNRR